MNEHIKKHNSSLLDSTAKALEKRGFDVYTCDQKEDALSLVLDLIPEGNTVSFGGSVTLDEIGVLDELKKRSQPMIDRRLAKDHNEYVEIMRSALLCDTFLMSANAISADGQLVNIDGSGNRVAALCYGPREVIVIAGVNKIAPNLDSAIARARNVAAPINAGRFEDTTPCQKIGRCGDCISDDCICAQIVITRMDRSHGRIKVVLVNEDLGF